MSRKISTGAESVFAVSTVLVDSRREGTHLPWWRDGRRGICRDGTAEVLYLLGTSFRSRYKRQRQSPGSTLSVSGGRLLVRGDKERVKRSYGIRTRGAGERSSAGSFATDIVRGLSSNNGGRLLSGSDNHSNAHLFGGGACRRAFVEMEGDNLSGGGKMERTADKRG